MFVLFFIMGFTSLIFPLIGIKKFKTEKLGSKITRIVFIVIGCFLIYVGIMDAYTLITDPSNYL